MPTAKYVALLRGINVGGRNRVPMAELRGCLEDAGYGTVSTYIQSGNVLLATSRAATGLEAHIEATLEQQFGYPIIVVVRSLRQLRAVVATAPDGFGTQPTRYHSDVLFLRSSLTGKDVMRVVELRDGVDRAWPGTGVVYFERLSERRTQSRMSRIASTPAYQQMTIRNWATTTTLLRLLEDLVP